MGVKACDRHGCENVMCDRLSARIYHGEAHRALGALAPSSVRCVVTSPPYWRQRRFSGSELGSADSVEQYIESLSRTFRAVWRVLTDDGTCWVNLADTYASSSIVADDGTFVLARRKGLILVPQRFALRVAEDGWIVRCNIVWSKHNPTPHSVCDRPVTSHEDVLMLAKSTRYMYDQDAIREPHRDLAGPPGRLGNVGQKRPGIRKAGARSRIRCEIPPKDGYNPKGRKARSVWTIPTARRMGRDHTATFPPELARRCILAGSGQGDTVLDPFCGTGTAGLVALEHGRMFVGVDSDRATCERAVRELEGKGHEAWLA